MILILKHLNNVIAINAKSSGMGTYKHFTRVSIALAENNIFVEPESWSKNRLN